MFIRKSVEELRPADTHKRALTGFRVPARHAVVFRVTDMVAEVNGFAVGHILDF